MTAEQDLAPWAGALATADGDTAVDRILNHRPGYAQAMRAVEAAIWSQEVVDHGVLELCRLRIAQLLGTSTHVRPEVADVKVSALASWPTNAAFSHRERVCLGHAEQVLLDASGLDDADAGAVVEEIGSDGYAVLSYACGFFETTARLQLLLTGGG